MRHQWFVILLSGSAAGVTWGCTQRIDVGELEVRAAGGGDGGSGGDSVGSGGAPSVTLDLFEQRIVCSERASCAMTSADGVACWGNNSDGELGSGDTIANSPTPVNVMGLASDVDSIFGGGPVHCAITGNRTSCWGAALFGEVNDAFIRADTNVPFELPFVGDDTVLIAAGLAWSCLLTREGTAKCWGFGSGGVLGNGGTDDSFLARDVAQGDARFVHIAAAGAGFHNCGATADGTVLCWGRNGAGQLGDPGAEGLTPVAAMGVEAAVEVAVGKSHSCARSADGMVQCWGDASLGQLGSATGGMVPSIPAAMELTAGGDETCILGDDGAVWCWGMTHLGTAPQPPHEQISAAFGAIAVRRGGGHGCAINAANVVRCWGADDRGQTAGGEVSL